MPRIISESKRWPGSVTVFDQLTLPQVELIERALEPVEPGPDGRIFLTAKDKKIIPALLVCVEKWDLANFPTPPTLDAWPMTPRKESHALIDQLWRALMDVYTGEQEVPNG
jgi:hypothetical protein